MHSFTQPDSPLEKINMRMWPPSLRLAETKVSGILLGAVPGALSKSTGLVVPLLKSLISISRGKLEF